MSTFLFGNNIKTTLAAPITSTTATTCTLSSSANLPTLSAGQIFALTFNDAAATGLVYEIVYCTARTGAVLTIVRGQEGTTAQTWLATDLAYCSVTAGILSSFTQDTPGATPLDTSATAQTKVGALTVTGGLTSGAGVAVGGALTTATTGAFSGLITASGGLTAAGQTITTGAISMPGVGVNGFKMTPISDAQNGTWTVTNSAGSTNVLELNQLTSSTAELLMIGNLISTFSGAFSNPTPSIGDLIAQRSTSTGGLYLGGAVSAFVGNWNASTTNQLTMLSNFVGFANFVAGTYTNSSDERLKENIVDLPHGLAELRQLRAIKYNFKSDKDSTHFGFSAQHVQTVLPHLVGEGEQIHISKTETLDKPLGIKQPHLLALVARAVQQLDDKHEAQAAAFAAYVKAHP